VCSLSAPVLVLVEGEHDITFFRKSLELRGCTTLKTLKTLEAEHQIRRLFRGVLMVDCEGAPKLYRIIIKLMRQIIVNLPLPFPRLVAIGDSDRFSIGALLEKMSFYLNTPCKAHNLQFDIRQTNSSVSLSEATKNRLLEIDCHIVPESLEIQIYEKIPRHVRHRIPSEAPIGSKLRTAAGLLNLPDLKSLIEESTTWLAPTGWVAATLQNILAP